MPGHLASLKPVHSNASNVSFLPQESLAQPQTFHRHLFSFVPRDKSRTGHGLCQCSPSPPPRAAPERQGVASLALPQKARGPSVPGEMPAPGSYLGLAWNFPFPAAHPQWESGQWWVLAGDKVGQASIPSQGHSRQRS